MSFWDDEVPCGPGETLCEFSWSIVILDLNRFAEHSAPPCCTVERSWGNPSRSPRKAASMWVWLDVLGQILIDATLETTVLLSLVVLILLRCRQPARRIVVTQAAILSAVLMLPLVALVPLPRFNLITWLRRDLIPGPLRSELTGLLHRVQPSAAPEGSSGIARESPVRRNWDARQRPVRILALIYGSGVLIGLTWLALGLWAVRRLIRESVASSSSTLELYRALDHEAEEKASWPELRVSSRVRSPVLAGLLRSWIIIPPALDDPQLEQDSLRLILHHELAHSSQRDPWFGAGANLAQTLWFFLPYVWWLRELLRIDQEFVADQKAVLRYGTSAGYAQKLVALASVHGGPVSGSLMADALPSLPGWWWDGGFKSPLLQRVVMLLHCPFPVETRAPRWWSLTMPVMILSMAILFSRLGFSWDGAETPALDHSPVPKNEPRTFGIPCFVAAPQTVNCSSRAFPYVFPLILPPRFELTVEIQAGLATLSQLRLCGYFLARPSLPLSQVRDRASVLPDDPNARHLVLLRRDAHGVTLRIDGQEVPVQTDPGAKTDWLTIKPAPDQPALLHNLLITW
jgi:beta-lactamase regulating signal transducer with metallopeptidase domain